MRLGLFGGTFNPIHYGHLRAAEEACELLQLDRLLFIPAARPPHKEGRVVTPFALRYEMTRLAVADHPRLAVSDLENRRPDKSYSIDTLKVIRQEYGPAAEIFFVVGLDAMLEIDTWKSYRELFHLCHFLVLDRPGYERRQLTALLQDKVHPEISYQPELEAFRHPTGNLIYLRHITLLEISSTRIRQLVREGRSIRFLLPEEVRRFIINNRLYLDEEDAYAQGQAERHRQG